MTEYIKDMQIELKLFKLYGLREIIAAAKTTQVAQADFVPLAETVLPDNQARAFAARWPTLTMDEQSEICLMLEQDHG